MIEDGYFVQFFSDDEAKQQEPRNIIVIQNRKVSFYIKPQKNMKRLKHGFIAQVYPNDWKYLKEFANCHD